MSKRKTENTAPLFTDAVPYDGPLIIGVGGGTGSGKTMSAMLLAAGLKGEHGQIVGIDTEHRRMLLYHPPFTFKHYDFREPFSPERYVEALHAAGQIAGKDGVIVLDSATHEWNGTGGVLDMAEAKLEELVTAAERRANGSYEVNPERYTPLSWGHAKGEHKRFIQELIKTDAHLIVSYRAENKIEFGTDDKKRLKVTELGPQLITGRREDPAYECLMFMMFDKAKPGRPLFSHKPLYDKLHGLFGKHDADDYGELVTRVHGRALRYWRTGMTIEDSLAAAHEDRARASEGRSNRKPKPEAEPATETETTNSETVALFVPGEKKPRNFGNRVDAALWLSAWSHEPGRLAEQIQAALERNYDVLKYDDAARVFMLRQLELKQPAHNPTHNSPTEPATDEKQGGLL